MNSTLKIDQMIPFGNYSFSFSKPTKEFKNTVRLYVGECVIIHLPITIEKHEMKLLHRIMKDSHTDILEYQGHYYTTTSNSLIMVKHPLIKKG